MIASWVILPWRWAEQRAAIDILSQHAQLQCPELEVVAVYPRIDTWGCRAGDPGNLALQCSGKCVWLCSGEGWLLYSC